MLYEYFFVGEHRILIGYEQVMQKINVNRLIWDILSSDFYSNIISSLELIVGVIAIIVGGKKVLELISEFQKKQREAVFGFYINLGYFIKRIRPLVFSDDGSPLQTLYILSPNEELNSLCESSSLYNKLSNVAFECLQYLSSKADQIPPVNNLSDWIRWKKVLDSFVDYLNQFYLMGSDNYLPGLNSEKDIIDYCEQFGKILNQIELKIAQETGEFFNDLKNELDLEQRI